MYEVGWCEFVLLFMKNFKKIVLTIIALVVLVLGGMIFSKTFSSTSDGSITVELVELDGSLKSSKEIEFETGDQLLTLIEENYENVVVENGMIMSIDTFTTASDWSTFISIDVNGEASMVGLNEIEYEDGMIISFKMTEFIYE